MNGRGVQSLRALRGFRNRTGPDVSIANALKELERDVVKRQRAVGGIGAAWEEIAPARLSGRCQVVGVSRGVLTIRAADAATRFELDRFLRSGGERELARRAGVAIKKTKLL
jgi:hypothetical protein